MSGYRRFWIIWVLTLLFLLLLFVFVRAIFVERVVRGPFVAIARAFSIPVARVDGYLLRYADVALHARVLESEGMSESFEVARESSADLLRLQRIFEDAGIEYTEDSIITETDREVMRRYELTEREWRSVFGTRMTMIQQLSQEMTRNAVLQASAKQETESIIDLLESGVAFSDLAREFSLDRSSVIGGSLGAQSPEFLIERLEPNRPEELVTALTASDYSIVDAKAGFIILTSTPITDALFDVSIIITPKDNLQTIVDRYRARYPLKRIY